MLRQISEFEKIMLCRMSQNKGTVLLVLYLVTLAWYKNYIFALYEVYGAIFVSICLLGLPLILMFIHYGKSVKSIASDQVNTDVIRQLSDQQLYILRKNIPTAQINLLNEILLVSLGLLYDLLTSLPSKENTNKTLFDDKFEEIVRLFKAISQRTEFINGTVSSRSQNNAIVSFAFYRLLFDGVLESAKKSNILTDHIDQWILLKRIPPGINQHLGAQNWRLYELKTILFDDLQSLEVNEDIKATLIELCPENNSVNPSEDSSNEKSQLVSKIMKWLPRQIKNQPINQANYFYMDIDTFGKETLFLSDVALSAFSKKNQLTLNEVKQSVTSFDSGKSKSFRLEGAHNCELYAMNIPFGVEVLNAVPGLIKEVNV